MTCPPSRARRSSARVVGVGLVPERMYRSASRSAALARSRGTGSLRSSRLSPVIAGCGGIGLWLRTASVSRRAALLTSCCMWRGPAGYRFGRGGVVPRCADASAGMRVDQRSVAADTTPRAGKGRNGVTLRWSRPAHWTSARFLPSSAADVDRRFAFGRRVTLVPASLGPPAIRTVLRRLGVPRSVTSPRSYDGPNAWLSGLTLKKPQRDHGLPHVDWPPLPQRRWE